MPFDDGGLLLVVLVLDVGLLETIRAGLLGITGSALRTLVGGTSGCLYALYA